MGHSPSVARLTALRRDLNGAVAEVCAADLTSVPDINRFTGAYRSAIATNS